MNKGKQDKDIISFITQRIETKHAGHKCVLNISSRTSAVQAFDKAYLLRNDNQDLTLI